MLSFLGLTAFYRGDLAAARRLHEESLAIWVALDDRQGIVWARARLGDVLARQGAYAAAYDQFVTGLAIAGELDFRWGLSWACDGLAHLAAGHDAAPLAARLAATAEAIREATGLRLAPLEQAELDRLLEQIRAKIGARNFATVWSCRQRWALDELRRTVDEMLRPVCTDGSAPSGSE